MLIRRVRRRGDVGVEPQPSGSNAGFSVDDELHLDFGSRLPCRAHYLDHERVGKTRRGGIAHAIARHDAHRCRGAGRAVACADADQHAYYEERA